MASGAIYKGPMVRVATFLLGAGHDAVARYNGFLFDSKQDRKNVQTILENFVGLQISFDFIK